MTTLQRGGTGPVAARGSRLVAPTSVAVAAFAAVTLLHQRDPHVSGSYGTCPWLGLTGLACPGCGGLRAVHDLSHGDLAGAASSNLLVIVLLLPVAVAAWLMWARARWRGRPLALPPSQPLAQPLSQSLAPSLAQSLAWSMLVLVLAFGVVRNLSVGSWLSP